MFQFVMYHFTHYGVHMDYRNCHPYSKRVGLRTIGSC